MSFVENTLKYAFTNVLMFKYVYSITITSMIGFMSKGNKNDFSVSMNSL